MKTWMRLVVLTLAAAVLLSAAPAMAQPTGKADVQKRLAKARRKLLKKKVGLTSAKIKQVESTFATFRAKRTKLQKQKKTHRRALRKLARSDSDDQAAYKKAIDDFLATRKAIRSLEDDQMAALRKILTPKEQVKLLQASMKLKRQLRKARRRARRAGRQ